jgi:hypothetical protein
LSNYRVFRGIVATAIGLVLTLAVAIPGTAQEHQGGRAEKLANACKSANGTWVEAYWECEFVDPQLCSANGGRFEGCASACRHNPDPDPTTPCTMQCVPLCSIAPSVNKNTKNGDQGQQGPPAGQWSKE